MAQSQSDVLQIIAQVAESMGIDPNFAIAVARYESNLNPDAIGDNGNSVGLFQLNAQGEGAGMTVAQREDPATNARIALTQIKTVMEQHPDWSPGQIAAAAQRPADQAAYAQAINNEYQGNPSSSGGPSSAYQSGQSGPGGGLLPPFQNWDPKSQGRRTDQGWDLQAAPNTPVVAAASGTIHYAHDPNGFGQNYPVLYLDSPYQGNTAIYYGHVGPSVPDGTHVNAGQVIATTLQQPGGNASGNPGWLEIGFWGQNGPTGDGGAMEAALMGPDQLSSAGTPAAPTNGTIPPGAAVFQVGNTDYIVYDIGDGVKVAYTLIPGSTVYNLPPARQMSPDEFNFYMNGAGGAAQPIINAGPANELFSMDATKSFVDQINQLFANAGYDPNGAAANDPQVRALLFKYAEQGPNHIDEQTLTNLLQQTKYYQSLTAQAQKWNNPTTTQAEKQAEISTAASTLMQQYQQATGVLLSLTDPTLTSWAMKMASGQLTQAQIFEQWIKPTALSMGTSPLAEQTAQAQNQVSYDTGNSIEQIRQLYTQWGVPFSDSTLQQLGQKLAYHQTTINDITNSLRQQAKTLYPWMDPNVDTQTQAQPWMSTYESILERPATLDNPDIQKALTEGMPPYQFAQYLRSKDEWKTTQNFQQSWSNTLTSLGQQMGFVK